MPSQASYNVSLSHVAWTVDTPGLARKASPCLDSPRNIFLSAIFALGFHICHICTAMLISHLHFSILFFFYVWLCYYCWTVSFIYLFIFALLVGAVSFRSCTCCRIDKVFKTCEQLHLSSSDAPSPHIHSQGAQTCRENCLSDTTMFKKITAFMPVSWSLASFRQQNSLLIFHCEECLLLIQIPVQSRDPTPGSFAVHVLSTCN